MVEFVGQNVHETVARARFHIKICKDSGSTFGFVWSGSHGNMCTRLPRELDLTRTLIAPEHSWKMQLAWSAFSPSCQRGNA